MKHKLLILLLSIMTALIFVVGVAGCVDSSNGQVKFSYELNDDKTYTVKGINGAPSGEYVIEIPSTYKDLPITKIALKAFSGNEVATGVIIPESVTVIGWDAFYNCKNLKTIKLPDSLTSIGDKAFYGTAYYNNESNWNNGVLYIGNHLIEAKDTIAGSCNIKEGALCIANDAFNGCTSLTSVTMGNSVTFIGVGAFGGCTSLTSVTIGNGVTSIGDSAFKGCTSLTSVTMGNSVTEINKMAFNNCSGLTSITLTKSVTYIGNAALGHVSDVYYSGTTQEWNEIEKDSNWISSFSYTIHCSDGDISK